MDTRINKLVEWLENHPMKLVDCVHDVAYDYFDDEDAKTYFDNFYMSAKKAVEEIIEEETPYGCGPTSDDVLMHYNVSIITTAWFTANFMRQQLAQGEDFEDIFNLEAELCRKYPILREAFDILDKDEEPVEKTAFDKEPLPELPF